MGFSPPATYPPSSPRINPTRNAPPPTHAIPLLRLHVLLQVPPRGKRSMGNPGLLRGLLEGVDRVPQYWGTRFSVLALPVATGCRQIRSRLRPDHFALRAIPRPGPRRGVQGHCRGCPMAVEAILWRLWPPLVRNFLPGLPPRVCRPSAIPLCGGFSEPAPLRRGPGPLACSRVSIGFDNIVGTDFRFASVGAAIKNCHLAKIDNDSR